MELRCFDGRLVLGALEHCLWLASLKAKVIHLNMFFGWCIMVRGFGYWFLRLVSVYPDAPKCAGKLAIEPESIRTEKHWI